MNKLNIYVKGITNNSVNCYLLPDSDDTPIRIQARLKIDESIHNTFVEALTTPYLTVLVDGGMIVGVERNGVIEEATQSMSVVDTIYKIVKEAGSIKKKDLFAIIETTHNISYKTLQRKLKDMENIFVEIQTNYNMVWYNG